MLSIAFGLLGAMGIFVTTLASFILVAFMSLELGSLKKPILPAYVYLAVFSNSLSILLSDRNFDLTGELISTQKSMIVEWAIRLTSLIGVLSSLDIFNRVFFKKTMTLSFEQRLLASGLGIFWLSSVLSPCLLGYRPHIEVSYFYGVLIGIACILSDQNTKFETIKAVTYSAVLLTALGALLVVIKPSIVLDGTYSQGYISGLPRFAGLAPHAITNAVLICCGIVGLCIVPFKNPWVNRLAWGLMIAALLMTQAKAAIASLLVAMIIRQIVLTIKTAKDPTTPVLICLVSLMIAGAAFIGIKGVVHELLGSKDVANLTSFTGRDVIWEVAMAEWRHHPIFGYGPLLFSEAYRQEVGMYWATGGHNQIIDLLARSGLVGLIGFIAFYVGLVTAAIRSGSQTAYFSLVMVIFCSMRFMTEVSFQLKRTGLDTVTLILVLVLATTQIQKAHDKDR